MPKEITFDAALKTFQRSTAASMKAATLCAVMALEHFAKHQDVTLCQRFLDAMPKNYVRRAAYLKWLAAFSPVTMEKGKLGLDKKANAKPFNVAGAKAIQFWDYAPEAEITTLDDEAAFGKLLSAIKYLRGKSVSVSETVKTKLVDIEKNILDAQKEAKSIVVPA